MPLKKGKKGKKGKGKGKKGGKSGSVEKQGKIPDDTIKLEYPAPPPLPTGQALVNLLKKREVEEKELFNHKLSVKILEELSPEEIRDLKAVFDTFDGNGDGFIMALELRNALRVLGFVIPQERAKEIANKTARFGFVSLTDFLQLVIDLQGESRDDMDEILKGFELLDTGRQGHFGVDEIKEACVQTGLRLSHKEILAMIEEADYNGDGLVDKVEFVRIMRKTNLY